MRDDHRFEPIACRQRFETGVLENDAHQFAVVFGVVHEADEGAAAHIWQILMAAQLPLLAYFIVKWLPSRPRESLLVLGLLAGTWLANFAAVYWLT